ncbi:SHC SH2 domain-binding protein 1 isoform X2 [Thalassophryne amazonica]|uniref:SHC SH2 domain-binding protein 1 isoform X2 n=1 Tax=Thalassophryne amazonica TaxID=390379 RepID=UPI0014708C75|nr:SHC SH2 domain-binding protein 1 isoform X2 [Thalassophryne amazonica]
MELEAVEGVSSGTVWTSDRTRPEPEIMTEAVKFDLNSVINVEVQVDDTGRTEERHEDSHVAQVVFSNKDEEEGDESADHDDYDDDDSGTDYVHAEQLQTQLQRREHQGGTHSSLPDTFQTSQLLFYERFKAYQDYMLGDCKPSEVKDFIGDYVEKVVEPCDWQALWSTAVFDVLVEVDDMDFKELKACVKLVLPLQCESRGCELDEEAMKCLLEATGHKVPLQELQVVYRESGDLDQTALAVEHIRFFYQHIWRQWDEEDEDDDFDYFVRCVEPRLRLYYDILEDRVPAGLVAEYQSLLEQCNQCFHQFSMLCRGLGNDPDLEPDNVSMVEGLALCDQLETFKRKMHIIENPLLRYVLGYKGNTRQQSVQSRGPRESDVKVVHVVTESCTTVQLQSLLSDRLLAVSSTEDAEIQFHRDPVQAVDSCHQGDAVVVLPGLYSVTSSICLPDSVTIEGFGLPDDVVIEKKGKGDSFIESTGADVKLSNIKFKQHDAIEGIVCVREGKLTLENCVLQCETTGVIVRTSAHLTMNMCDIYGSKDFADKLDMMPSITMENNVIHNNEGYGVILVKASNAEQHKLQALPGEGEGTAEVGTRCTDELEGCVPDDDITPTMAAPDSDGQSPTAAIPTTSLLENDVAATVSRKWQFCRQLTRNKEATCSRAVEGLMEHEIFVSAQGNQFVRNGMGDFGTFFY